MSFLWPLRIMYAGVYNTRRSDCSRTLWEPKKRQVGISTPTKMAGTAIARASTQYGMGFGVVIQPRLTTKMSAASGDILPQIGLGYVRIESNVVTVYKCIRLLV